MGEWFQIEPREILPILMAEGQNEFIAKNADSFEITGYDRDAAPEYLGVWPWRDLEIQRCCTFCGCFCGMHYQDAFLMHHRVNCDAFTDFSTPSHDREA